MDRQTVLMGILIIVVAVTALAWFRYSQTVPSLEPAEDLSPEASLGELRRLKTIKLDASVFQDPFFKSMEAPTTPTMPAIEIKAGRANPFLPF